MAVKKKTAKTKKAVSKPVKSKNSKSSKVTAKNKPVKKVVAKKPAAKKPVKAKPVKNKPVAAKTKVAKPEVKKVVAKKAVEVKPAPKNAYVKPVVSKPPVNRNNIAAHTGDKQATEKYIKPVQKKATEKPAAKTPVTPIPKPIFRPIMPIPPHKPAPVKAAVLPVQRNPNGTEKTRYSDPELKEFKVLIVDKLNDARVELVNLNAAIISANENGTDDTSASFKMLEDGSDTLAKEEAAQLAARQKKFIEQLESALLRIENKTYGICRVTGKLIPKERLRAVPHTTQSMEAKLQQYKD